MLVNNFNVAGSKPGDTGNSNQTDGTKNSTNSNEGSKKKIKKNKKKYSTDVDNVLAAAVIVDVRIHKNMNLRIHLTNQRHIHPS